MSANVQTPTDPTFTLFPHLPTELRLKIWHHVHEQQPPRPIPIHLHKSDLDYLRLRRKACHNYPHIFSSSLPIPSLLHVCQESRSVALPHYTLGFDISRILSMGKADDDVEMYTTCSHEVACEEEQKAEVYWNREKDMLFFDTAGWKEHPAYVWGGKTGMKFGKVKRVAMDLDTLTACGIGEYLGFEGVDDLFVLNAGVEDPTRVKIHLASRGLVNGGGGPVNVYFEFEDVERVVDYLAGELLEASVSPQRSSCEASGQSTA